MDFEICMVWNVFKSQSKEEELSLHEILDVKCSWNSHLTIIPFEMNSECRLPCSQCWQRRYYAFQKRALSNFALPIPIWFGGTNEVEGDRAAQEGREIIDG